MSMKTVFAGGCAVVLALFSLTACQEQKTSTQAESGAIHETQQGGNMMITSPVFAHQQAIPAQYTCDGEDYSPALEWSHVPKEAKSLALVCEDPDASMGNWIHWLVVNIPAQCTGIPENGPLPEGALALKNSWGKTSYGGPCPPSGRHRYFFKLYALKVESLEGATAANFRQLIARYSLAQSELMGTYQRAK